MPVAIVCALIVVNLGVFLERCARFDRVALDMVMAHGVSPAGEQDAASAAGQVQAAIVAAMDDEGLEVKVRTERLDLLEDGVLEAIAPGRVRFVCELSYRPRPSALSIAGVQLQAPVLLTHTRSVVVDAGRVGIGAGG